MKKLVAIAGLMAFSMFAFTRMEASESVRRCAQIAELQSTIEEQAIKIAELESELECRDAIAEPAGEGSP